MGAIHGSTGDRYYAAEDVELEAWPPGTIQSGEADSIPRANRTDRGNHSGWSGATFEVSPWSQATWMEAAAEGQVNPTWTRLDGLVVQDANASIGISILTKPFGRHRRKRPALFERLLPTGVVGLHYTRQR